MAVSQEVSRPLRMTVWWLYAHGPVGGFKQRTPCPVCVAQSQQGASGSKGHWEQGSASFSGETCGDRWLTPTPVIAWHWLHQILKLGHNPKKNVPRITKLNVLPFCWEGEWGQKLSYKNKGYFLHTWVEQLRNIQLIILGWTDSHSVAMM